MESVSDTESSNPIERIGRLMLLSSLHAVRDGEENPMDLALIRAMHKASLTGTNAIPWPPDEKRVRAARMDAPDATSKLRELYVWAKADTRPVYVAIPAECILETIPLMRKWQGLEGQGMNLAVSSRVCRNNFTMEPRRRPACNYFADAAAESMF
jgi:hypothetical protein